MYQTILFLLLITCATAFEVPDSELSLMQGGGVKFATADDSRMKLVAYHYSVNKVIHGVAAGDHNVDVNSPTGGYWVHEDEDLAVTEGDVIYFWTNVILKDNSGYNNLDQSWTVTASVTQSTPAAVTQAPTTEATSSRVPSVVTATQAPPTTEATSTLVPPVVTTIQSTSATGTTARTTQGSTTVTVPPGAGKLIFEDTFDTFDLDVWEHEITASGGGNWEFQYYTNNRSNSYVRNNVLYIKPTLTEDTFGTGFLSSGTLNLWGGSPADLCTGNNFWGCERAGNTANFLNPIQSARLRTVNSFAFKHGKIEVIAQMPKGDWLWPAIWLLPKRNGYGQWPASGEIDIVEARGNRNLTTASGTYVGIQQVGMTTHWGPFTGLNQYQRTHGTKNLPSGQTFADDFHNYTMIWTAENMTFYLDGEQILKVDPGPKGFWEYGEFAKHYPGIANPWVNSPNKLAPFDQEFYIIMNVAVGGTNKFFSDDDKNHPNEKPWSNKSPTAAKDFWDKRADWYPTWNSASNNGEDAAMKVRSVRVYAL